jgi:hypothetical protein
VPRRERLGDHAAHRGADDVRGVEVEPAQQARGVIRHVRQRVLAPGKPAHDELVEPWRRHRAHARRVAGVAVVEAHDVEPRPARSRQNESCQAIICMPRPMTSSSGGSPESPKVS